jgi:hypothetical protein
MSGKYLPGNFKPMDTGKDAEKDTEKDTEKDKGQAGGATRRRRLQVRLVTRIYIGHRAIVRTSFHRR